MRVTFYHRRRPYSRTKTLLIVNIDQYLPILRHAPLWLWPKDRNSNTNTRTGTYHSYNDLVISNAFVQPIHNLNELYPFRLSVMKCVYIVITPTTHRRFVGNILP